MQWFTSSPELLDAMSEVTAVGGLPPSTAEDQATKRPKPRFAPPSRGPFEGFGNALTTAIEIVVVTILGYFLGRRLAGPIGGGAGLALGAAASFVRLYYRTGRFESPLARAKRKVEEGNE